MTKLSTEIKEGIIRFGKIEAIKAKEENRKSNSVFIYYEVPVPEELE